jgi:WD40 repeat protein
VVDLDSGRELMTTSTQAGPGILAGSFGAAVSPIVALSPDGRLLATVGSDRFLRMWEVSTGTQVWALAPGRTDTPFVPPLPLFSPDGTRLLVCRWPGAPRVVDVATGETIVSPSGGFGCGTPFSADGSRIAFGVSRGGSDRVEVWDLRERTRVAAAPYAEIGSGGTFVGPGALSPDGRVLALGGGPQQNVILLRDADTLAPLDRLEHRVRVFQVTFSLDGTRIVTSSDDGAARIWNAQTGELIFTSLDETSDLKGAVFSQDGSRIALFYSDGRILVHAIAFDDVLEIAKGRVTRSLTDAECRTYLHVAACPT